MPMKIEPLFPTLVAQGRLPGAEALNRRLTAEIRELARRDKAGREWSKQNYRGGYTSYGSVSDLQYRSPAFADLAERLQPFAEAFARAQGWKLEGLSLDMNACWANVMPRHTYHTLHLHPHSVLSGAYYVKTPKGSVSLKLEDPRMGLYMNAPVRESKAGAGLYREITPVEGTFVLFESWLRHEVPPNFSAEPRVSVSFNYSLDADD